MELNGLIAFTVILGTIGHVWFLCLNKTQTLHSHSCVHRTDAGSNLFEQDITPQPRHQARHRYQKFTLYLKRMVKKKFSSKPSKGVAKAKKTEHKIKWNPNSAHKNQTLQHCTEKDMEEAMRMWNEGKHSQRAISRATGIHVATLNKCFKALVKGMGHHLSGKWPPKVLKHGT